MTSYKLNEEKMYADIDEGIAIIINSETGIYYGMNAFATQVYENIEKGISTEKILSAIKEIPSVPDTLEDNFNLFVNIMVQKGILIPAIESNEEIKISSNLALDEKFIIELKEYSDAQELLLADPIHELKEAENTNKAAV